MDMCCPLLLFTRDLPPPPCLSVLPCLAGGTQKGSIPLQSSFWFSLRGQLLQHLSHVFLFFQSWGCHCALRHLRAASPGAALSLTHEGHMPGQAPVARAHLALPLSTCSCVERQQPAKVLTEDPRAHLSWRTGAVTRVIAYCN